MVAFEYYSMSTTTATLMTVNISRDLVTFIVAGILRAVSLVSDFCCSYHNARSLILIVK